MPPRRALIDANLLTLLVVGGVSRDEIARNKRTQQYDIEALDLLLHVLDDYDEILATPNVFTEASNLINSLTGSHLQAARIIIGETVSVWTEQYVASNQAVMLPEYLRLGVTDAGLLLVADEGIELLTDDLDLYLAVATRKAPVTYFTHLRTKGWTGIE